MIRKSVYSAKERMPRLATYWFIDTPGTMPDKSYRTMKTAPCRETGHRFDTEHFITGNYFATQEDAQNALADIIRRYQFRVSYLAELNEMKNMSPLQKEKYLRKLERRMKKDE